MATITVTTNLDVVNAGDGVTSLREAVTQANANPDADTIVFAAALAGQQITLTNDQLDLNQAVTIDGDVNGDNKADITISGNNASRIFTVESGVTAAVLSLTLTNGFVDAGQGAGIYARSGSTLSISDTTIRDSATFAVNTGDQAYGGGIASRGTLTVTNSTITGNTGQSGGGVFVTGTATFINSTIHGNTAQDIGGTGGFGGGIESEGATLTILNSTVTGNYASYQSGGINVLGGSATVTNSVVAGNTAAIPEPDIGGFGLTAQNSFFGTAVTIDTNLGGNINNGGDPGLGALQDNGGTVQTRNINAGSQLIDAGNNAAPGLPPTDANGIDRTVGSAVDIGATEFQLIVTTDTDDAFGGGTLAAETADGGGLSLREALGFTNASTIADRIGFAQNLAGATIVLTGALALTNDVTIDGDVNGDNKADITLSGGNVNGIVNITGATTDVDLKSLTLTGGLATDGGAVSAQNIASLDIIDTTISGNQAINRGGGVFANYVNSLRMVNSLVTDNVAINGGGLYTRVTTATLTNTTIHGNEGDSFGGGISSAYATVNLLNSTITGNRADANGDAYGTGGGLDIFNSAITIANTVVADNFAGGGAVENDVNGTVTTATNSIFGTDIDITTNVGSTENVADVGLGQLLDNGGTTLTRSPLDGSVLIGAGLNSAIPLDVLDVDGDGNLTERLPLDGRRDFRIRVATVDVGAVEQATDETIGGTAAADTILGGLGNDILRGRGGSDTLDGGAGTADTADYSEATGTGVTVNLGILVAQLISATEGSDTLLGIENVTGSAQNDMLTGDGGINRLSGLAGDDTLRDGAGADILDGGLNNDTFLLDADGVSDTIIGGDGTADIVNLFFATGATSVTFGATAFAGTAGGGGLGSNSFTGIERIFGSAFVDTILGGASGEFLAARGGSDVISGGGGGDRLFGEAGNDTINDGSGVDVVIGGADNDALFLAADNQSDTVVGDTGTDTLDLFHASGATTVVFGATAFAGTASGGGLGTTSFTGIERIFGGNFAETIIGGAGGEYFFGRAGSDSIFGAQGSDIIFGDIGNDRLNGTAGADFLSGGADADTFVYTHQSQGADTFADFATGIDKVEIARTGFGLAPAYVLNFQTGAAAIGAGQVFLFNPANRQFLFDADGAGAMASVLLATLSVGSIAAGDILLV